MNDVKEPSKEKRYLEKPTSDHVVNHYFSIIGIHNISKRQELVLGYFGETTKDLPNIVIISKYKKYCEGIRETKIKWNYFKSYIKEKTNGTRNKR